MEQDFTNQRDSRLVRNEKRPESWRVFGGSKKSPKQCIQAPIGDLHRTTRFFTEPALERSEGLGVTNESGFSDMSVSSSIESQIGGVQTVHTEDQRDFAAMMQIVFHYMVDYPTARHLVHLTIPFVREG